VAVVEAEGETVLVAVVHEAAVVVEAEENVDPGSPSTRTSRAMKHDNLLRMRSTMRRVAFRRSCVSRQAIELTEEKTPCYKRRSRLASNSDGEVDWPGGECKTIIDSGA